MQFVSSLLTAKRTRLVTLFASRNKRYYDSEGLLLQSDSYINEKIIAVMGNADISNEWDDSFGEIINMRLCT